MFKVNNKDTRTASIDVVLVYLMSNLDLFHYFSSVSTADLEQVIAAGEYYNISRSGSRTVATFKVEVFVIIVNGFSSCDNS